MIMGRIAVEETLQSEDRGRYVFWCRCKLGEGRYYWIVSALGEEGVFAEGYAGSHEEAESAAQAALERVRLPDDHVHPGRASWAANRHSEKCRAARREKPASGTGSNVREYLYTHHIPEQGDPYWSAHPILKKTAKRVWVARWGISLDRLGTDPEEEAWILRRADDEPAIVLERQVLEREGNAGTRRSYETFYLRPETGYEQVSTVPAPVLAALDVLGLSWPCSAVDVRAAYRRLSLECHPDVGGSAERFRRVNEAYERAVASVA
jgi:hypothetical protein